MNVFFSTVGLFLCFMVGSIRETISSWIWLVTASSCLRSSVPIYCSKRASNTGYVICSIHENMWISIDSLGARSRFVLREPTWSQIWTRFCRCQDLLHGARTWLDVAWFGATSCAYASSAHIPYYYVDEIRCRFTFDVHTKVSQCFTGWRIYSLNELVFWNHLPRW